MSGGYFRTTRGRPARFRAATCRTAGAARDLLSRGPAPGHISTSEGHLGCMASTGQFDTNFHTEAATSAHRSRPNRALDLDWNTGELSDFYGLCGLPGFGATAIGYAGCNAGQRPVHRLGNRSCWDRRASAGDHGQPVPRNNPGNLNQRDFLQLFSAPTNYQTTATTRWRPTSPTTRHRSTHLPRRLPELRLQPNSTTGTDAGISQYQLYGPSSAAAAGLCELESSPALPRLALAAADDQSVAEPHLFRREGRLFQQRGRLHLHLGQPVPVRGRALRHHAGYDQPVDAGVEPNQATARSAI